MSDAQVGRPHPSNNRRQSRKDIPRIPIIRSACNRCHSQKLRCSRPGNGEGPCERCLRLGAVCVYGESRRAGRPRDNSSQVTKQSPASQIGSQNYTSPGEQGQRDDSFDMLSSLDLAANGQLGMQSTQQLPEWSDSALWAPWPSHNYMVTAHLDPNQGISGRLEGQQAILSSSVGDRSPQVLLAEPEITSQTSHATNIVDHIMRPQSLPEIYISATPPFVNPTRDMEGSIHQLSELQMSLYRCSRAVSFIILNEETTQTSSLTANTSSSSSPYQSLHHTAPSQELQSVYNTSERFLDIVNGLMSILQGKTIDEILSQHSSILSPRSQILAQVSPSNAFPWLSNSDDTTTSQQVDSATVVLVSSCYLRLIFIYSTLVEKLVQKCRSRVPMSVPNSMRVEQFSLSSSDMQVVMLLQFVSHLFGRISKTAETFFLATENANGLSIGELQRKEAELRCKLEEVKALVDRSTVL